MKAKKRAGTSNFIYSNFKLGLDYLGSIKKYLWISGLLFLVFTIIGFLFPNFFQQQIIDFVKKITVETRDLGTLDLIRFIFLNNLQSSFVAMIFGLIFCVIPALVLVVNGYVLGFVANRAVGVYGFAILWKLLPHGIFEIPAILISVAMGLKLGTFLFVPHKNIKKDFFEWLINVVRVFILIVIPLLIIAAIIEGSLIVLMG